MIRPARRGDVAAIVSLVHELAEYERADPTGGPAVTDGPGRHTVTCPGGYVDSRTSRRPRG